ncbi:MAG: hypothetical protein IT561_16445 [Alphaproteobacteria bacterium]|nr:hypothetical protein [Alphaproteobacteria bacterium]
MKRGLLLATSIGLAGASAIVLAATSSSTDATWAAIGKLEDGSSVYCAGGTVPMPEWAWQTEGQVDLKGSTLTFTTASRAPNSSFSVDLKALQPDGSGTAEARDDKNRRFYVTLAPGSGARPFRVTYSYNACRRVYTPSA